MKVSPEAFWVLSGMKKRYTQQMSCVDSSVCFRIFPFYGGKGFLKKRILAENCRFGVFPEFFLFPGRAFCRVILLQAPGFFRIAWLHTWLCLRDA